MPDYVWICLNMPEYAGICVNISKSAKYRLITEFTKNNDINITML